MSRSDPFTRLAPFIQTYIYRHRWEDLRAIQKAALPAIMDTNDHVLIMSGTASGKTEAALLPILTLLEQSPAESVGALYIGPLKALINDQFARIDLLLQDQPEIPIQGWHGDIAQHRKTNFLQQPRGILQITPESLEALLINHAGELSTIFSDLRFIIIDEIHAFLGTERGQQVLCHLQRLEQVLQRPVRRIGLSATIGNTEMALRWLESSARFRTRARLVNESTQGRRLELLVNHFVMDTNEREFEAAMASETPGKRGLDASPAAREPSTESPPGDEAAPVPTTRRELQREVKDYYDHLFAQTMRHQKTLIFTNQRNKTEQIAAQLRHRLAREKTDKDRYFVHHGSIAADLRELAEAKMRDEETPTCIIATATLELGIDVGHLDLTIQVDAPHTVSSFVQRLGRSGRRGSPARMGFYTAEYLGEETPSDLQQIPWNFLQTLAIIQLYLEEQWIEPPEFPGVPLSLLYQQTMSVMRAHTELTPAQLAQHILKLSPFQSVTLEEYRLFLQNLVTLDHLARMEEGTLIVGTKGEQFTNHHHFYAIFAENQECRVVIGNQELGTIQGLPGLESTIGLAGYAWRVISVDEHRRIVHVERAKGKIKPTWFSQANEQFHEHVMQRIRRALQEETVYPYLAPQAQQRLALVREQAKEADWLRSCVARLEPGRFALFPWTGSRVFKTLSRILQFAGWDIRHPRSCPYIEVIYDGDAGAMIAELRKLAPQVPALARTLVSELKDSQLYQGKYDSLAPRALLEKAYLNDVLDIPGTTQWLETCS